MSRVLFLAYNFPPLGGPGTQRSVAFVRHLPGLGHRPIVVTGPGTSSGRWDPPDPTLGGLLPADLEVLRASGPLPTGGGGRLNRVLDRRPPFAEWWVRAAVEAAQPALDRADLIYASMAPYETGEAAARLAHLSGVPWIADLRDPWALDEMRVYPTAVHRRRDASRMRQVLRTAHAIVMNTPEAARALLEAFPELSLKLVACIPNGYEAADFAGPSRAPEPPDRFRIVHTGSLHTELGRRQARRRGLRRALGGGDIDILARSHVHLVRALELLQRREPELAPRVELHLAGALTEADREAAAGAPTVFHGYLDHEASVALVRSADLLFLPMHDLPRGARARIVPGKAYEYLASGRPLLAAVPDGDARDLVAAAPQAFVTAPTDASAMADVIARELRRTARLGRRPDRPPLEIHRYDRRRLTADLAEVFDHFAARGTPPATAGQRQLRLVS